MTLKTYMKCPLFKTPLFLVFQMLTYLMVARVAQLCPGAVLTKLDKLVEPLKMTVTTKVKANAVKQVSNKGIVLAHCNRVNNCLV